MAVLNYLPHALCKFQLHVYHCILTFRYQEDDASQQTPVWTTPLIEEMTPRTPDLTTPLKDETTPRTQNLTTTLTEEIPTRTMDQQPQPEDEDISSEDSQDTGGEAPPDEDCG